MWKPLPENLRDMTQAKWDKLSERERKALRDVSNLNPQLMPYIGQRVRVSPKRAFGRSTFFVGITTGWRPALLAMRAGTNGSSDLIGANETFDRIERI